MRCLPRIGILLCIVGILSTGPALRAEKEQATKIETSTIQVDIIQSDEPRVPMEFKAALYERLIQQLGKRGFQHVYREGDRNASNAADLIILHGTVRGFKRGSEEARQVTTVAGATSISVHCQFTNAKGQVLLERDVTGRVRFFGGNLRATYDFAKKASRVASENFSPTKGK